MRGLEIKLKNISWINHYLCSKGLLTTMRHHVSFNKSPRLVSALSKKFLFRCRSLDEGYLPFSFEIQGVGENHLSVGINCSGKDFFDLSVSFVVHPSEEGLNLIYEIL